MITFYQLQTKQAERQASTKATSGILNPAKRARGFLPFILLLCSYLLSPAHALAGQQHRLYVTANLLQQPIFRDSLRSNERLHRHEQLTSADGRFSLIMQGDGNLVLYENGMIPHWATDTVGSGATYAIMQSDGNLVLYTANDVAVWASDTSSDDSVSGSLLKLQNDGSFVIYRTGRGEIWATNKRFANQVLHVHEELISPNGRFNLVLQGDGNLVIYENRARALWATNTTGSEATKLVMQADGNLVLYTEGNYPLWTTNTGSNDPVLGPVMLLLNNYGNLVVQREPQGRIWTSTRVITTLLATSFEDLDISQPEEILPLVFQHNNFKFSPTSAYAGVSMAPNQSNWEIDRRARTGKYAINILPNGNPPRGDQWMASNALLTPSFDISQYKKIRLSLWVKSSWNQSDAEWKSQGDLVFVDQWNMSYWGAHTISNEELRNKHGQDGWWEITIDDNVSGDLSTIQFGFICIHPGDADPNAYFLIDDLQITAE